MTEAEDNLLMDQINGAANTAQKEGTSNADLGAMAAALHSHFPHRSETEILDKLKAAWRVRDLFWA